MTELKRIKTGNVLKSKAFGITLLSAVLLVVLSDIQWYVDEYVREINAYNSFNKLICVSPVTYGGMIFYKIFPLLVSVPYTVLKYCDKKKNGCDKDDFVSDLIPAFFSGGLIVFISYAVDFWLLSLITGSYYPFPNDMISGCSSGCFMSECFYLHPRLFVFAYAVLGFCFGGLFSFLCVSIFNLVKKVSVSLFLIMAVYFGEFFLAGMSGISSWMELLYSDHYRNDDGVTYLVNLLSIAAIVIIINTVLMLKNKEHRSVE